MPDFNALSDPHMVTPTGDFKAKPPTTGEPIANAPQPTQASVCDPRDVLVSEHVESPEDVLQGDFVRAQGWSRPRRVEFIDSAESGPVLFLADPDTSRTNEHGIRRLDSEGWQARGSWNRYPNLRRLWEAAHGDF